MLFRQSKTTIGLALAATVCIAAVAAASAQAAPIGAYTTKGTWKFLTRPDLHPPKLIELRNSNPKRLAPGFFMIANFKNLQVPQPMIGQGGPLILDNQLRPVWFGPVSQNVVATNLRAQTYNRKPVLTWWEGTISSTGEALTGKNIVVDQHYKRVATLAGKDGWVISPHEIAITGHNAWVTVYKNVPVPANQISAGGPRPGTLTDSAVQEYDLRTGKLLKTWDALGHIPLTDSEAAQPPLSTIAWDAYHVNAINLVPGGKLLVSMRNTWAGYLIDSKTGKILWTLGGKHSSFTPGPKATFAWQHDIQLHSGNQVSIFDDACCAIVGPGKFGPTSGPSRGLVLKLDTAGHTATFVRQYTHGKTPNSAFLGNTDLLSNGNVTVGWGSAPFFSEYSKSGRTLLDAELPNPNVTYRAFKQLWVGSPARPPSGAVRKVKHGVLVFAGWNGSTETVKWRVLAGRDASHLAVVATKARNGFETAIPLKASFKKYKVESLDASGHVLRISPAFPSPKPQSTLPPGY